MEHGTIKKTELGELIHAAVEKGTEFYAPVRLDRGIELKSVAGDKEIILDYSNVKLSPKSIFFPQREVLCRFSDDTLQGADIDAAPSIVFGVRPCDAAALSYLDHVFADADGKFRDPYYSARREHSLTIAIACNKPRTTCFCTSVDGSPVGTKGSDILATDIGDTLIFAACSDKGTEYLAQSGLFSEPTPEELEAKEEKARRAMDSMVEIQTPDIEGLKEKVDSNFEDPLWDSITQDCMGCGVCTYLCPTCHCFDITDEEDGKGDGVRLRTWDSCQYPLFTLHASGHNPRVNKKQRLRQRIMHKFSYAVANTGDIYCVGCGRCIVHCPVSNDIREALTALSTL